LYDADQRKLLSALAHGSIFFNAAIVSILLPIALMSSSNDPVVKENAKEALNFHLTIWIYAAVAIVLAIACFLLSFALAPLKDQAAGLIVALFGIAWLLFAVIVTLGFAVPWVLAIVAVVQCMSNPDQPYRYPFIFRFIS